MKTTIQFTTPRALRHALLAATFFTILLHGVAFAAEKTASYPGLKPDEFMKNWLVLGSIPVSADKPPDESVQKKIFADDLLAAAGGETAIKPQAGSKVAIGGKEYQWRLVESKNDTVDLNFPGQSEEYVVAYAWAEIEMSEPIQGLLGIGSDDGVKVWLNGKSIHEHWMGRAARADDDVVAVGLTKGRNQLLVKVQNMPGPWGLVCRLMGEQPQARKLIVATRRGDLDAAKLLLRQGVNVNARNPTGLTAAQAARISGQTEMLDFLAGQGADMKAPIPPAETLVDGLFTHLVKADAPGAAVLVAQQGKVVFKKGYGLANVGHRVPVTTETRFRIGSITKQFTAAAILKLQEDGKLSVQDQLSKFIPDYPRGDEVTVHHLLTHTSGIHSYTSKPEFFESVTAPVKTEDHLKTFKGDPYDFDPGKKWLYNNSGYFLLGYIIEKVSGKSYADFLRAAFFDPLGMKNTGVHASTAIIENEAEGYQFEGGEFKKALNWDMSRAGGAGALYSTVEDLHRWNEALFLGKVLSEASLKAAFTPVKVEGDDPAKPKEDGYGYGWSIAKLRGLQDISHGGGLHGFVSYLLRLPSEYFTVAVLANAAPGAPGVDPAGLAREAAELFLGEKLAPLQLAKVDRGVSPESFAAYEGRYDYGGAILAVVKEGDRLFAQLTGQPKFEIFPETTNEFFWKVVEAKVKFVKNDAGQVLKALHRQGGQTIDAPKLEDFVEVKVKPETLDPWVGKYDYGQGKSIMTVTREGSRLFAQLTGQPKFEIHPKSETEFFWKMVNAQVTFVKDEKGKVTKAIHRQAGRTFDAPRMQ